MTGRLLLLAAISACYSPSAAPGAPCNPTTANCPEGQSCLLLGGSYACATGPGPVADAAHDTPVFDAPRDAAIVIDAPPDSSIAPWVLVQTGSSESSPTMSLPAAAGTGHLIIVAVQTGSTVVAVTDDGANMYSEVPNSRATANNGGLGIDLWYAKSTNAAKNISVAASSVNAIVAWEVSGLRSTNPLDVSAATSNQAATTLPVGASVTTTQPGDFIVEVAMVLNQVNGIHAGNEFTNDSGAKANGWAHITSTGAPAGPHQARWDQPMSGTYCAASAAFFAGP